MKLKIFVLSFMLAFFASNSFATNVDEWVYKDASGDLKSNPGCIAKEKAIEKVTKDYRFNKYSKMICQALGYGWSRAEVLDKGEVVCEECGGDYAGKYRCHVKDVKVKCKQVKRSW